MTRPGKLSWKGALLQGQASLQAEAVDTNNADDLVCPITQERFVDPVIAADGVSYEREAIQAWISLWPDDELLLSPVRNEKLPHRALMTDVRARQRLAEMVRVVRG